MKKHFLLSAMTLSMMLGNTYAQSTPCAQAYEPNATRPAAYNVSLGADYQAAIAAAGDIDYYKVTVPAGTYMVNLTNLTHDIDIRVENASGQTVASSEHGGTYNEQFSTSLSAGTYYFKVYPYTGYNANSCYTFNVTTACAQAYEHNNTPGTAYAVNIGTNYNAAIGTSGDMDYYKITVPSGNFTVNLTNLTHDVDISIDDANGESLASSQQGGTTSEQMTASLNAGTYYLRVYPYEGYNPTTCYNLIVTSNTSTATACAQAYEPNNSTAAATTISLGVEYQATIGAQGDKDYYKVYMPTASSYTATLTGLTYDGVLTETVYMFNGSEGAGSGFSQHPGTADESITHTTGAGWLMFHVSSIGNSAEFDPNNCYTFKVVQNYPVSLTNWNNAGDNTTPISVYPNPATDRLTIKLNKKSAEGAQIRIFDLAGKEVMIQKAVEGENVMNISSLASASYMISVENGTDRIHQKFTKQ